MALLLLPYPVFGEQANAHQQTLPTTITTLPCRRCLIHDRWEGDE